MYESTDAVAVGDPRRRIKTVTEMEFSMTRDYNSGTDTNVHTVDDRQGVDNRQGVDDGGMPTVDNSSVRSFTLSYSSQFQNRRNTSYPFTTVIGASDSSGDESSSDSGEAVKKLAKTVRFDHVAAIFNDGINTQGNTVRGYRNKKCFQSSRSE